MYGKDKSKIAGSIGLIVGVWLVLFTFAMGLGITSSAFAVGALLIVFSLVEFYSAESIVWVSWIDGILSLWLLLSPLFIKTMASGEKWNSVILGAIIMATAIWGGTSSKIGMGHPKVS